MEERKENMLTLGDLLIAYEKQTERNIELFNLKRKAEEEREYTQGVEQAQIFEALISSWKQLEKDKAEREKDKVIGDFFITSGRARCNFITRRNQRCTRFSVQDGRCNFHLGKETREQE